MDFKTNITLKEYQKSMWSHIYTTKGHIKYILFGIFVMTLLSWNEFDIHNLTSFIPFIIFIIIFSLGGKLGLLYKVKSAYKQNPKFSEVKEYNIDEDSIRIASKDTDLTLNWDGFLYWQKDKYSYRLYTSKNCFHIIPFRDLDGKMQQSFETLLDTKIY